jgi:2-succinyl-5-enolpyruvyl-6-hydroxy-3-cyclohexene-1-carboxylate synthase
MADPSSIPEPPVASAPDPARNARVALLLLEGLRRSGLGHLVVCPGSRSGPLAVAAALLEGRGVRLHTAIDERSAAFFAVGLGRAEGRPAAVITTSGTAVANLLPAAVEADFGGIPLLLLTADRPRRLKCCGANQSVNQEDFLVGSCRWLGQADAEGLHRLGMPELAALAERAMAASGGGAGGAPPGPVHLNLPFEEPLHAGGGALAELEAWLQLQPLEVAAPAPAPAAPPCRDSAGGPAPLDPDLPGVVVAGPWRGPPSGWAAHREALVRWQRRSGWPVLADPLSGLRGDPDLEVVAGYDLLLERAPAGLAVPQVLRLGRLPASRRLERWLCGLDAVQVLVSEGEPRRLDPLGVVALQTSAGLAGWLDGQASPGGTATPAAAARASARRWRRAEGRLQAGLEEWLDPAAGGGAASEPWLARALAAQLPAELPVMLANSSPVRDWEAFAGAGRRRPIHGFRGASGIDGTLSLACGLAEALGRLLLVSGDLALLHDANGWLWGRRLRGRLTVVVIENGGGGIFEQLPIRTEPAWALDFERLFAMPQPLDPAALAALHGVPSRCLASPADLGRELAWALEQRLALLVVRTDRRRDALLRGRLRTMAAEAIAQP